MGKCLVLFSSLLKCNHELETLPSLPGTEAANLASLGMGQKITGPAFLLPGHTSGLLWEGREASVSSRPPPAQPWVFFTGLSGN